MKVLNREQFLALPQRTLFHKFEPIVEDQLCVFLGKCGTDDFVYQGLGLSAIESAGGRDTIDLLFKAIDSNGELSIPTDFNCAGRDGMFDKGQLFLVYEKQDVEKLIGLLQECISP